MDLTKLSVEELQYLEKVASMSKSDLTTEQLGNILKVAKESVKQGVNPYFVLPMVMQESGFSSSAKSKAGAFGVMQLMPATANGLKVDPADNDQNISGGVALIKELMANPKIGNDPYKILAGYNAGPTTKFLTSGNLSDLPLETLQHMEKVSNYYGGDLPTVQAEPTTETDTKKPPLDLTPKKNANGVIEEPKLPTGMAAVAGAALGVPIGGAVGVAAAKYKAAKDIGSLAMKIPSVMEAVKSGIPLKDAMEMMAKSAISSTPTSLPAAQGEFPSKTTGTYAYGKKFGLTNTEAANAVDMSKRPGGVWDLKTKADEALKKIGPGYVSAPDRADIMLPDSAGRGPRESLVKTVSSEGAAPTETWTSKTKQPIPPVVAQTAEPVAASSPLAQKAAQYLKYLQYPVKGGLAGLSAGFGAADVYNRVKDKNYGEAAASAVGTLAGVAAPFLGAGALGALPISVAIPLYLQAVDRGRHLQKHPEDFQEDTSNTDAMGNLRY